MPRPGRRTLLGIGIPALVVLVFVGAWAFDTSAASGLTLRNVTIDGHDVGMRSPEEVRETVTGLSDELAEVPIEIDTGDRVLEATAGDVGLTIDVDETVREVLRAGRDTPTLLRPLGWARSFVSPHEVDPRFRVRPDVMALSIAALEGDEARRPVEPSIVASPEVVQVDPGQAGLALDPEEVGDALLDAAAAGEDPITVSVRPVETRPTVTDEEAQELADRATEATAEPFVVTVAGQQVTFEVPELRTWLGSEITPEGIVLTFDAAAITDTLVERSPSLGESEPRDARFDVVGGAVQITPSVTGLTCCADDSATRIIDALRAGEHATTIEPVEAEPELTTEEAEALGIREPVGTTVEWNGQQQVRSFTTYHACCGSRVHNIHTMADAVRGALVLPGETFSINEHVGQRTTAKGYLAAGAIANGEHVDEVGGGVSQFATTLFNAAFFAGLPFGEYQAHSEHFSRYPYGREATMGWEHPDLQFVNDTPYGILIWTSYTDTSLTVTLYSTQHAWGEQTGQSESPSGNCVSVTTQRTIHYPDGSTAVDTVGARYRQGGATSC